MVYYCSDVIGSSTDDMIEGTDTDEYTGAVVKSVRFQEFVDVRVYLLQKSASNESLARSLFQRFRLWVKSNLCASSQYAHAEDEDYENTSPSAEDNLRYFGPRTYTLLQYLRQKK